MLVKEVLKEDFVKVDQNEHVSKLIGLLKSHHKRAALVFDGTKLVGISRKDSLIKTKIDPAQLKVKKVVIKTPILNGDEDIKDAARLLYTSNSPLLPVVSRKKLLGVVNGIDIVSQIKNTPESKIKIGDIMTVAPITLTETDRLGKAIEIMNERRISRLPVVDKRGRIIGIVSVGDLVEKYELFLQSKSETHGKGAFISSSGHMKTRGFRSEKNKFASYPVINFASTEIITAGKDEKVGEVIRKMETYGISSIVITENDKPIGIITLRDLLKLLLKGNVTY